MKGMTFRMRSFSDPIRTSRAALAILLALSTPAGATPSPKPSPLEAGREVHRDLAAGESHAYVVELERGDFLAVSVQQQGMDVIVTASGPDSQKIQDFDSPTGARGLESIALLARASGPHLLEVRALDAKVAGRYAIRLDQRLKPAERMGHRQPLVSPRLIALRERLAAGDSAALDRFWQEVRAQGTPLVEPVPETPGQVLVTFLWRAEPDTVNAYALSELDRTLEGGRMERMPGTDVYCKSYRVRSDARFTYSLSINDSEVPLHLVDWENGREGEKRSITFRPDPLNPRRFPEDPGVPDAFVSSLVELPDAAPQPWREPRPDVPAGTLAREVFRSEMLKNARLVQIYTPPGYRADGEPYDLLLLFGGRSYSVEVPAPVILDNLLAAKRIRPLVAVLVASPGLEVRNVELSCHPPFVDFLVDELLPWVRQRYHVTADPGRTTVGGFSLGGLTAAFAALRRPDVFGNVLSQSGSFWWKPKDDPEPEWLTRQLAVSPKVPVRFYVEVGVLENGPKNEGPSMLMVNRHLRDVLTAKGYEVIYREFSGDHQSTSWRGTLADALQALYGAQP